jgi:hypothetical protein
MRPPPTQKPQHVTTRRAQPIKEGRSETGDQNAEELAVTMEKNTRFCTIRFEDGGERQSYIFFLKSTKGVIASHSLYNPTSALKEIVLYKQSHTGELDLGHTTAKRNLHLYPLEGRDCTIVVFDGINPHRDLTVHMRSKADPIVTAVTPFRVRGDRNGNRVIESGTKAIRLRSGMTMNFKMPDQDEPYKHNMDEAVQIAGLRGGAGFCSLPYALSNPFIMKKLLGIHVGSLDERSIVAPLYLEDLDQTNEIRSEGFTLDVSRGEMLQLDDPITVITPSGREKTFPTLFINHEVVNNPGWTKGVDNEVILTDKQAFRPTKNDYHRTIVNTGTTTQVDGRTITLEPPYPVKRKPTALKGFITQRMVGTLILFLFLLHCTTTNALQPDPPNSTDPKLSLDLSTGTLILTCVLCLVYLMLFMAGQISASLVSISKLPLAFLSYFTVYALINLLTTDGDGFTHIFSNWLTGSLNEFLTETFPLWYPLLILRMNYVHALELMLGSPGFIPRAISFIKSFAGWYLAHISITSSGTHKVLTLLSLLTLEVAIGIDSVLLLGLISRTVASGTRTLNGTTLICPSTLLIMLARHSVAIWVWTSVAYVTVWLTQSSLTHFPHGIFLEILSTPFLVIPPAIPSPRSSILTSILFFIAHSTLYSVLWMWNPLIAMFGSVVEVMIKLEILTRTPSVFIMVNRFRLLPRPILIGIAQNLIRLQLWYLASILIRLSFSNESSLFFPVVLTFLAHLLLDLWILKPSNPPPNGYILLPQE